MRFSISNSELSKGVQIVSRAINPRNTINALTGIYIEAKNNKIILKGTDLDIGIKCSLKANIEENGCTVIPATNFTELVRKLPTTDILISKEEDQGKLNLKYLNSELSLNTYDSSQFSFLPELDKFSEFEIDSSIFSEIIKQVSIAISQDDSRPVFTGVYFENIDNNKLRLVSTDTHRLSIRDCSLSELNNFKPLIIPGKALMEINKILDKEENNINIKLGNNQSTFVSNNIEVKVRLIDGQFPSYNDVLPDDFSTEIKVNTKSLIDSIDRAIIMSYDKTKSSSNIVKLQLKNNVLSVNSKSPELGYVHEELDVYSKGEDIEIAFNGRYIIDVLKVLGDEEVKLKLKGSLSPAIIQGENLSEYIYLVLPLRT